MRLKAKATGTVSEIDTLEAIDIDSVRQVARSVDFSPPTQKKILCSIRYINYL